MKDVVTSFPGFSPTWEAEYPGKKVEIYNAFW